MTVPFPGRHSSDYFRKEEGASTERVSMDTLERWLTVLPRPAVHTFCRGQRTTGFDSCLKKQAPCPRVFLERCAKDGAPEVAWGKEGCSLCAEGRGRFEALMVYLHLLP